MDTIRAFVALTIPQEVRELIWNEVSKPLQKLDIKVSWVKPENMHITVRFLGDIPIPLADNICRNLARVAASIPPIETAVGIAGTFGGKVPRVIWVAPKGNAELMRSVSKRVEKALARLGIAPDRKAFSPHITVGRVRDKKNTDKLLDKLKEIDSPHKNFALEQFTLYKSTLTPNGSVYNIVCEYPLAGKEER